MKAEHIPVHKPGDSTVPPSSTDRETNRIRSSLLALFSPCITMALDWTGTQISIVKQLRGITIAKEHHQEAQQWLVNSIPKLEQKTALSTFDIAQVLLFVNAMRCSRQAWRNHLPALRQWHAANPSCITWSTNSSAINKLCLDIGKCE